MLKWNINSIICVKKKKLYLIFQYFLQLFLQLLSASLHNNVDTE